MGPTNGKITILMLERLILHFRQATVIGFSAMTLSILAFPAQADLMNGSFTSVGTDPSTGMAYTTSYAVLPGNLPDWTIDYPVPDPDLDCVVFPGTALSNTCGLNPANNSGDSYWSDPGPVPGGGNYLAVDGDPAYSDPVSQTITGLAQNQAYTLSFYQGAAQFKAKNGKTTERWLVSFDTVGTGGIGGTSCSVITLDNSAGCESQLSTLMNNAPMGSVDWTSPQSSQSLTFIAQNTTEVLSFFAVGAPGGEPPVVLLGDVSLAAVPEPEAWMLLGSVLLGVSIAHRRRNRRS